MGRKAIHSSAAERTRAYRARLAERQADPQPCPTPPAPRRKIKPPSRPKRFELALDELNAIMESLQAWRDSLPENLQSSALADKLEAAIDGFTDGISTLEAIDMPLGFGRD